MTRIHRRSSISTLAILVSFAKCNLLIVFRLRCFTHACLMYARCIRESNTRGKTNKCRYFIAISAAVLTRPAGAGRYTSQTWYLLTMSALHGKAKGQACLLHLHGSCIETWHLNKRKLILCCNGTTNRTCALVC